MSLNADFLAIASEAHCPGDFLSAGLTRLMRAAEVIELTGFSPSGLYQRCNEGKFPKPVKVGPRSVRWRYDEIEAWLSAISAERDSNSRV